MYGQHLDGFCVVEKIVDHVFHQKNEIYLKIWKIVSF